MTPYQTIIRRFAVILLTGLLLESCAVQEQGRTNGEVAEELDQTISVTTLNQAEVYQGTPSDDRQRLIADVAHARDATSCVFDPGLERPSTPRPHDSNFFSHSHSLVPKS